MPRLLTLALAFALLTPSALAQIAMDKVPAVDRSPMDMARYNPDGEGDAEIEVVYSRPYKRDRVIFGELVPYGEIWRTGANEATTIRLSEDATLGGQEVPAGTYQLFTIPHPDRWTVVLNRALGQWGAYSYDESQDLVRFDVPVVTLPEPVENFSVMFSEMEDGPAMVLAWDRTAAVIPVRD